MKPGIYPDISFKDYKALDAMNWSTLKHGQTSMKHLKAAVDGRLEYADSPSKRFGRAVHCGVLEPDVFEERFVVASPCCAILASGKNAGKRCGLNASYLVPVDIEPNRDSLMGVDIDAEWRCGKHNLGFDRIQEPDTVSETELTQIAGIKHSLANHGAVKIISAKGGCEVTAVWEHDGILCKGRFDKYIEDVDGRPTIVDLKTCGSGEIDYESIQRAIVDYSYHCQAAFYSQGVEYHADKQPRFVWVFIEKREPFDVNAIIADDDTIRIGDIEVEALLGNWKHSTETGVYRGVAERLEQGGLPEWKRKQFAEPVESATP